ncbi:MAG: hypothetical protein IT555_00325 [Acetobacteraceae bacterium]|nr:hypothetical protein [Acetobacteraceae bacterium]
MTETTQQQFGKLAAQCGQRLPLQVCQSRAGFYVGTLDADGLPYSRESVEYWPRRAPADKALSTGTFTQRAEP